jgi:hypothetical protein
MVVNETQTHRRRALLTALAAVVVVYVLWNIPALSGVLYPFRLFVTFVHETGHGTMALLSGGRFLNFVINGDGSGFAVTAGGSPLLILPAGYLGAALFGAVLFYLTNTVRHSRTISVVLGIAILVIAVFFGLSSITALLIGGLFGAALVAIGWKAKRDINLLVLNVLSIMTGLNAVLDLYGLINNSGASLGDVRNDAAALSAAVAPIIPAWTWAVLWALAAVAMLGASVWFSIFRPMRRNQVEV